VSSQISSEQKGSAQITQALRIVDQQVQQSSVNVSGGASGSVSVSGTQESASGGTLNVSQTTTTSVGGSVNVPGTGGASGAGTVNSFSNTTVRASGGGEVRGGQ